MAAVASEGARELACLLIPLGEQGLLLPNECIAEVLPWRRVRPLPDAPAWCVGSLKWRGEEVIVVRFAVLNGAEAGAQPPDRCIVVLNRARSTGAPKFYALAASGLPRAVQLQPGDLANRPHRLGGAEVAAVSVGVEPAVIPNLEFVEAAVRAIL